LGLARSAFALVWTRFHNVYDAPHFTGFTKAVVEIVVAAKETQIRQVPDNGTYSHALKKIDPGAALRANDVRSSDRNPDVGQS
jgi:hypothetical protein